jgi:NAD-dependent DNA ligase
MKLFDEAKEIVELLRNASDSYYNNSESIITDAEYDAKKDRLVTLYNRVLVPKKSVDLNFVKEVESFLSQIGAPVISSEWKKAVHRIIMTSLNKVNSQEEFETWTSDIGDTSYVMFDKMDGGSFYDQNIRILDKFLRMFHKKNPYFRQSYIVAFY